MIRPIFYFSDPTSELSRVQPGGVLRLGAEEGQYATTVHQVRKGKGLNLIDGYGTRVLCEAVPADKQGPDCRLLSLRYEEAPHVRLVLVQALAKGGRDEQAIETCAVISIDGVILWQSDRTIVRWVGAKTKERRAKWENTMHTTAEQVRRIWVPLAEGVADSRGLLQGIEALICQSERTFIHHGEAVETLSVRLRTYPLTGCEPGGEIQITMRSEGGICSEETSAFEQTGVEFIDLGRNALCSSTTDAVCLTLPSAALNRL